VSATLAVQQFAAPVWDPVYLTRPDSSGDRPPVERGIANILHRETIAVIVGSRTFERGERCFAAKRVQRVEASGGELRGVVRPSEGGRAPYAVRIWVRAEGLAYECTCPIGAQNQFCKHTVAIALAHLEQERAEAERGLGVLREALHAIPQPALIEGLLVLARRDNDWADTLKRMCLEALSRS
jgi:uncharacterized Zn finger protein